MFCFGDYFAISYQLSVFTCQLLNLSSPLGKPPTTTAFPDPSPIMTNLVIVTWPCLRFIDSSLDSPEKQLVTVAPVTNPNPKPSYDTSDTLAKNHAVSWKDVTNNTKTSYQAKNTSKPNQNTTKTFAQAVSNLCDIPTSY